MKKDRSTWDVIESVVLIIGGGFGGLWAAVRAAECGASVTLVDKSFAGKSGHSYFASGAMMVKLPEDSIDEYVRDVSVGNDWLVDQEMVAAIFEGSFQRLKEVEGFGFAFRKQGGKYVSTRARGTANVRNLWPENGSAADEVTILRKIAISRGVRFVDHVYIYDLAKDTEDGVAGAIGIGVWESRNYLFKASSTILATNSGSYRGHHLACELQGTGPFMAYDAGARIMNPEFHYINIRPVKHEIEGSGILPAVGAKWVNAKGVHFMGAYDPVLKDRAPASRIVVSAAREALAGNAPITIDVQGMSEEEREQFRLLMVSHGWMPVLYEKCRKEEGYDMLRDNIEWQPAYETNKLGVEADLSGRTPIKGLFAAGMARTLGINPFTGWSICACTWSGYVAGESASAYAGETARKEIDYGYLSQRHRDFLAPLGRPSSLDPDRLVRELQEILFPADVLIIMSESKLARALDEVLELKREKLPQMKATDTRTLIKTRETETMMLSAEMTLRASLMRKERRENIFYRDDYPGPDNENWLRWILVEKAEDGSMRFTTEPVPVERYRFQPG